MRHFPFVWMSGVMVGMIAALFCGCRSGYTELQERQAKEIMRGRLFYENGKGTPAEYATNQRGQLNPEGAIVRGEVSGDYASAVRKLSGCYADAALGFAWKSPRLKLAIPAMTAAPDIDGELRRGEWNSAHRFDGEYVLNSESPTPNSKSEWYIGWKDGKIFVAARFQDRDLHIFSGTNASPREPRLFLGDSLEFFLRPQTRQRRYFELLVNPAGKFWGMEHYSNPWGGHIMLDDQLEIGRAAGKAIPGGYSVELELPLEGFHGVWCHRPAKAGDSFEFILVRTNQDGGKYTKHSPIPFLYDGHNIFGYIQATLTKTAATKKGCAR